MTPGPVKRSPKKQDASTMSRQEAAWLAWYLCAVSLFLSAFGLAFLVASQSLVSARIYDYWLLTPLWQLASHR
jgi:hypothetical protein